MADEPKKKDAGEQKKEETTALMLEVEHTLSSDYQVLNMTKVLNFIASADPNPITSEKVTCGDLPVIPRKDIKTSVYLTLDPDIKLTVMLNRFDKAVFDAFCTFLDQAHRPHPVFTPEIIARKLYGCDDQPHVRFSDKQIAEVIRSCDSMLPVLAKIECTSELVARGVIGPNDRMTLQGHLLPVEKITYEKDGIKTIAGNHKEVHIGYRVTSTPIVYSYAKITGQLATIPAALYRGGDVSNTSENVVLRRYLMERIAAMKNPHNRQWSFNISYEYWVYEEDKTQIREDGSYPRTKVLKGMLVTLGYKASDYDDPRKWAKKRSKIHRSVCAILKAFQDNDYIKGYTIEYDKLKSPGRKKIGGVRIILNDSDMAEIEKVKARRQKAAAKKKAARKKKEAHT